MSLQFMIAFAAVILAGVEAMTGFLLISCSASHTFRIMSE